VGGFSQAAVGVPSAVWGEGARNCRFVACKFVNLGTYGLELGRGCRSNQVVRCEFGDLGAGGVRLGETAISRECLEQSGDNEVADYNIHHGDEFFRAPSASDAIAEQSSHAQSDSRLLLHGNRWWTWGYAGVAQAIS
jgi:hypothetical protein